MRVLVTWGSKHGGTVDIGRIIGETLANRGFEVVATSVEDVRSLADFDAVIVGGALYANRWPPKVRRFVSSNARKLREVPVWFFSSGPLDDSADKWTIPPPPQVAVLAERVGAKGHVTFGGYLARDAKGFMASSMAKTSAGDFRNPERIRAWAAELATELPVALPGKFIDHPARSIPRLVALGVSGWGLCAAAMGALVGVTSLATALVLHALLAPAIFVALAVHYFRARGARDPLPTALAWTAIVAVLDLTLILFQRSFSPLASITGTWLPFALIFLATWATGSVMSTLPWTETKAPKSSGIAAGRPRRA